MRRERERMPVLIFVLLALAIWLLSCGQAPTVEGPKLAAGRYVADGYVIQGSAVGKCEWLPLQYHSYVKVNAAGEVESPIPGTINCTTTYGDGVEIACTSTLGAELVAHASMYGDSKAVGLADAHGDVAGCKRLVIAFFLDLEVDP